jgi:hypothetical protein
MKEDSARVVRRSSGNSGEPAIQVICLVGYPVLVVFVKWLGACSSMYTMSQTVQTDNPTCHLATKG